MIPWAHNIYIESLIERGIVGLTSQVTLLLFIFARLWRNVKNASTALRPFHFSLLISFSGFLFAGFFELTLQRIWVANILFVYLGLAWNRKPKTT